MHVSKNLQEVPKTTTKTLILGFIQEKKLNKSKEIYKVKLSA